MGEWKECPLASLVDMNASSIDRAYPHEEILYLDTGSITNGKINSLQSFRIEDAPSRAKRLVRHLDIVYSTVRPIQRHFGILRNPAPNLVVSTGFAVLSAIQDKADPYFIYYLLTTDDAVDYLDMIAEASTSAYPSITPDVIADMRVPIPPLPEQRAIAEVLSSLDDKIDLLHRQNQTLEALAETLFRQWFVEEADEGWEMGKLGDVLELAYGKGLKEEIRSGTGYPVMGSSGVVGYHSEFLVIGPGIVIGRKGTLGKVNYVFENFFPIDTTYFIRSKVESRGLYYEYFLLKSLDLAHMNTDSAVPGLNRENALSLEISIPSKQQVFKFNVSCEPLFLKLRENVEQIRTLTQLRDTLLSKLMSGEVRVS